MNDSPPPAIGFKTVNVDLVAGQVIQPFGWELDQPRTQLFENLAAAAESSEQLAEATAGFPPYGPGSANDWTLVAEAIFERVRRDQFPQKPSRLGTVFLFETVEDALSFAHLRPPGHVFKCDYPADALLHRGDFHFNLGMRGPSRPEDFATDYQENVEAARRYWLGEPCCDSSRWEILLAPGLVVVTDGECLA